MSMGDMMAPAPAMLVDNADVAFASEMRTHHQVCTPGQTPHAKFKSDNSHSKIQSQAFVPFEDLTSMAVSHYICCCRGHPQLFAWQYPVGMFVQGNVLRFEQSIFYLGFPLTQHVFCSALLLHESC